MPFYLGLSDRDSKMQEHIEEIERDSPWKRRERSPDRKRPRPYRTIRSGGEDKDFHRQIQIKELRD